MRAFVLLLLLSASSSAFGQSVLSKTKIGASIGQLQAVLPGLGLLKQSEPQALKKGLVDSGLLETMTRLKCAPQDASGGFDGKRFSTIAVGKKNGRSYAAAFSASGLQYLLVKIPVGVDKGRDSGRGWSPKRLHRLPDALSALSRFGVRPFEKDPYGNVFSWRGRGAGGRVSAVYMPSKDELRVLLYP